MDEKEVRKYLNVIKRAVSFIESMLDNNDDGLLEQMVTPQPAPTIQVVPPPPPAVVQLEPPPVAPPPPPINLAARRKHVGDLMAIDCWPEALPSYLVKAKPSEEDQVNRANAVLDMMLEPHIEGKSFLDFGCGEGWIAQEVTKRGVRESMGYDVKVDPGWNLRKGVVFVGDYSAVPREAFDIIMLYDVLDHCKDPIDIMAKVRACLRPNGRISIRCHPWTSRHATHLWKQGINKAYWHLFVTWDEIKELIKQEPTFTRVEKNPLEAYRWWFKDFNIEKERVVSEPVSDFFHVPAFKELLANEQQIPMGEIDALLKRMEIQFVDYILSPR